MAFMRRMTSFDVMSEIVGIRRLIGQAYGSGDPIIKLTIKRKT